MPDLDLLPPGHVLTAGPRPSGGLGDVLVRASRRRRRQQGGVLATVAAACAAVLAFTMASGGAVDSLGVTPATQPGDGVLAPHPAGVDELAAPPVVDGAVGSVGNTTAQGSGAQPAAAQPRQDQARAAVAARQQAAGGEVGPAHTMVPYDASRGCGANGPTVVMGWCSYYDGATSGSSGQRVELAEALCRAPGQRAGHLRSDDGQQAEFSIIGQDAYTKWTWSNGHRFSKQGTAIDVPAGSCVRWHVTWNVRDDAGRQLPPGTYNLAANPWMNPPGNTQVNASAQVTTFTVLP